MTRLLKDGKVIPDDWTHVGDDDALPEPGWLAALTAYLQGDFDGAMSGATFSIDNGDLSFSTDTNVNVLVTAIRHPVKPGRSVTHNIRLTFYFILSLSSL